MHMQRERGISLIGLIVGIAILGVLGLIGAQIIPTFMEYRAIQTAIERAKKDGGESIQGIQGSFARSAETSYITALTSRDLMIERNGTEFDISFAYEKKIPLFGPASLLLEYEGTTAKADGAKKKKVD